jgi:uncharacterized protein (TIGR03067 family)
MQRMGLMPVTPFCPEGDFIMKWRLPTIFAITLLLAADRPEDAVEKEKAKLIGVWNVESVEANGQKVPAEAIKNFQFVFTADSLTRKKNGKAESGAGYQLEPSQSPKWIDMTGVADGKDVSVPALYEVEGDTLTLCFRTDYKKVDPAARKRPEKLAGGNGSEQVLMVLKRARS